MKKFFKNQTLVLLVGVVAFITSFAGTNLLTQADTNSANSKSEYTYVNLEATKASPDTLTVPVGKTIQFNAKDGEKHNISLGQGGEEHEHTGSFHSGDFGKDEAWQATFKKPGTYHFHDHYNPSINILVVAYQPSNN